MDPKPLETRAAHSTSSVRANSSFKIQSLHDGTYLECRVYQGPDNTARKGAIVAHPYAPLGGSMDDAVVQSIASLLLSDGFTVGVFNFRGAGRSGGRTSWSAKPELWDYVSFVGFFLAYLRCINPATSQCLHTPSGTDPQLSSASPEVSLLLGGYSYGAMITTQLPSLAEIASRFDQCTSGSAEANILAHARAQAASHMQSLGNEANVSPATPGLATMDDTAAVQGALNASATGIGAAAYLLVSPVLPPLSWAIALPVPFLRRRREASGSNGVAPKAPAEKFRHSPTLLVYSDDDQFTSGQRVRKWAAPLEQAAGTRFCMREVPGAGHFWGGALEALGREVRVWLRTQR